MKKIENFDREKALSLTGIIMARGKIEIVDQLANIKAVFLSSDDAAKFLSIAENRYVKLSFKNGRYDLFQPDSMAFKKGKDIEMIVTAVPIEDDSYKF